MNTTKNTTNTTNLTADDSSEELASDYYDISTEDCVLSALEKFITNLDKEENP